MIHNTLSFLIAIGVLVTVHEWGHFIFARKLGVKVLRFSIGFGPVLYSWKDKLNTEYAISLIPLGGYVKMLDESEGMVPDDELNQAFNQQTLWKRSLIVFAGPLVNFVFAFILLWIMFIIGVPVVKPFVGDVIENSISQRAGVLPGDEIVAVDGKSVENWQEIGWQIATHIGKQDSLFLKVERQDIAHELTLNLKHWIVSDSEPEVLASMGINPGLPKVKPQIDTVLNGGAAEMAGLLSGDLILQVDDAVIESWFEFVDIVKSSAGKELFIKIQRDNRIIERYMVPQADETQAPGIGRIGVSVKMPKVYRHKAYGPLDAIAVALKKTNDILELSVVMLSKLFVGEISVKSLGGPIAIAKGAGESASYGLVAFLSFLAYLSINLGLINLLPIPALDGGHLAFYAVEAIKGSPLSPNSQGVMMRLGVTLILVLMGFVIFNDVMRLSA